MVYLDETSPTEKSFEICIYEKVLNPYKFANVKGYIITAYLHSVIHILIFAQTEISLDLEQQQGQIIIYYSE